MFAIGRYVPSFLPPPTAAAKSREYEREVGIHHVRFVLPFLLGKSSNS